ncbi:MAG TPA: pyridoxal-phosphate dependent enzyme [Allosphingosinicella sp.]|jgi:threonine dehydratase
MWRASPAEIVAARSRIDPVFQNSRVRRSAALDRGAGAELLFKDETCNPIRSFKGRGACNLLARMPRAEGAVCASAGNFGQGLAWAAREQGLPVTIFAATGAVAAKVEAMRALGATVILQGRDYDEAKDRARDYARSAGLTYVEDGAHAEIAEGAGTIALELTAEAAGIDALLCPLGNGALAAGLGCWMKHSRPEAEMVAVAASGAPAMARSVLGGTIVTTPVADTIADRIAVRVPIPSAVREVRRLVDDVVLVPDEAIRTAMALLLDAFGIVVEPAGAAGFAALLNEPGRWAGKRVAIPLCGGNV